MSSPVRSFLAAMSEFTIDGVPARSLEEPSDAEWGSGRVGYLEAAGHRLTPGVDSRRVDTVHVGGVIGGLVEYGSSIEEMSLTSGSEDDLGTITLSDGEIDDRDTVFAAEGKFFQSFGQASSWLAKSGSIIVISVALNRVIH